MPVYRMFVGFISLLAPFFVYAESTPWVLEKHKDSVSVYQRDIDSSEYKETYGVIQIETKIDSLVALLRDTESYVLWMHDCEYAEVVKQINKKERIDYVVFGSPLFIADRDVYIYSNVNAKNGGKRVVINIESVNIDSEKNNNYVRITNLKGYWLFEEKKAGLIDVKYQLYSNPKIIFRSTADSNMVKSIFNTLKNVKSIVSQEKYREEKIHYNSEN